MASRRMGYFRKRTFVRSSACNVRKGVLPHEKIDLYAVVVGAALCLVRTGACRSRTGADADGKGSALREV